MSMQVTDPNFGTVAVAALRCVVLCGGFGGGGFEDIFESFFVQCLQPIYRPRQVEDLQYRMIELKNSL